jgi:hypothetical protein
MVSFWKIAAGKYRPEMSTDRQTLRTSNVTSKTTDSLYNFSGTISFSHGLQGREYDSLFVRGIKLNA